MIVVALGANLPSPVFGPPCDTLEAALGVLQNNGVTILAKSSWYRSAPVPYSNQPWYVNGVVSVETVADPAGLMRILHEIEEAFGRERSSPNAPRILDLDLIAYHDVVTCEGDWPTLPHPRLHLRAFVLIPLKEIAPLWRHPQNGVAIDELLEKLDPDQVTVKLPLPFSD